MRKLILTLIVSVFLFGYVGEVTALVGKSVLIRNSKTINLKIGEELLNNDKIKTENNSKVQIIFNDKTVITIGENSVFRIKKYKFSRFKKAKYAKFAHDNVARFKLVRGAVKTLDGAIGRTVPKNFTVKTVSATIGIRGTEFIVV